jgi:patatin-related protein
LKEKELRLALVCYGGVSLALYEHGITKEILSLVRASRAYHSHLDVVARQTEAYVYPVLDPREPGGTEAVYFDLLKALGATLDLRVIVDVITGSSAGGVNGITLARALAHDLSLEPLTDMWLSAADIQHLLAPEAKAHHWSKWYLRPFIAPLFWRLGREGLLPAVGDLEMRAALSTFLRSRWFHPPLDGPAFTGLLLDGLNAMAQGRPEGGSLLPAGHRLDLVVTVTDFFGSARAIFVHDPPVVLEREHRHVLRFSYEHPAGGAVLSELGRDHVPSLAFAARATASYPGAFPTAQLGEVDRVLEKRGEAWPARARFIAANFGHYIQAGFAPEDAVLVDGSVLNNKPLAEAIAAARAHRAFREVDRRLVYIDPHPQKEASRPNRAPSFFTTLRGALSDLPRAEPIYEELADINAFNDRVRRLRAVVEANSGQIGKLVAQVAGGGLGRRVDAERLRRWRLNGPRLLASTGLIYNGWIQLMIGEAAKLVAQLIAQACDYPPTSPRRRWLEEVVEAWGRRTGIYSVSYGYSPVRREDDLPPFGRFIVNFGVPYKRRRIAFVIQATNLLYHRVAERDCHVDPAALDVLKRRLYRCLDSLRVYDEPVFLSSDLARTVQDLFGGLPEVVARTTLPNPEAFVAERQAAISAAIDRLSDECDLVGLNEEMDALLASPAVASLGSVCQRELLTSYVGYLFWDIVLLPMVAAQGDDASVALQEILVDRISPDDAAILRLDKEGPILRGGSLAGFGGFFSRSTRENDYLWGRLHAVERLFDLLESTAGRETAASGIDVTAYKRRALDCVLKQEAQRLTHVGDLVSRLRAVLEGL